MAWKPEVMVAGEPGKWHGNALRFATMEEADANAANLMGRWMAVMEYRVVEVDEPINYRWIVGKGLEPVPGAGPNELVKEAV